MREVYESRVGPDGDCYEACVASVTDRARGEVPDFGDGDGWADRVRAWAASAGLAAEFFVPPGGVTARQWSPEGLAVGGVRLMNGEVHALVFQDGKVVHDPSARPLVHAGDDVVLWTVFGEGPSPETAPPA